MQNLRWKVLTEEPVICQKVPNALEALREAVAKREQHDNMDSLPSLAQHEAVDLWKFYDHFLATASARCDGASEPVVAVFMTATVDALVCIERLVFHGHGTSSPRSPRDVIAHRGAVTALLCDLVSHQLRFVDEPADHNARQTLVTIYELVKARLDWSQELAGVKAA